MSAFHASLGHRLSSPYMETHSLFYAVLNQKDGNSLDSNMRSASGKVTEVLRLVFKHMSRQVSLESQKKQAPKPWTRLVMLEMIEQQQEQPTISLSESTTPVTEHDTYQILAHVRNITSTSNPNHGTIAQVLCLERIYAASAHPICIVVHSPNGDPARDYQQDLPRTQVCSSEDEDEDVVKIHIAHVSADWLKGVPAARLAHTCLPLDRYVVVNRLQSGARPNPAASFTNTHRQAPAVQAPSAGEKKLVMQQPVMQQHVMQQHVIQQPVMKQPVIQQPVMQQAVKLEPGSQMLPSARPWQDFRAVERVAVVAGAAANAASSTTGRSQLKALFPGTPATPALPGKDREVAASIPAQQSASRELVKAVAGEKRPATEAAKDLAPSKLPQTHPRLG